MWSPDLINSCFLAIAGLLNWLNVRRAWKDKSVRGVSYWPCAAFSAWGVWDLYYFPHLNQWWSLFGTIIALLPNLVWLALYWKYRRN